MAESKEVVNGMTCHGRSGGKYHKSLLYFFTCPFCEVQFETTLSRARKSGNCGCQKAIRIALSAKGRVPVNKLPDDLATVSTIYAACHASARSKGFQMLLTREDVAEIVFLPCHYCGQAPELIRKVGAGVWARPGVPANGIDRINSELGYVEGNVLPCCSDCNYLKSGRSYEEFVDKVKAIASHLI